MFVGGSVCSWVRESVIFKREVVNRTISICHGNRKGGAVAQLPAQPRPLRSGNSPISPDCSS